MVGLAMSTMGDLIARRGARSRSTLATGSHVEARILGPTEFKGRSVPVVVHEITDVREVEERRRGLPGITSPMMEREQELSEAPERSRY